MEHGITKMSKLIDILMEVFPQCLEDSSDLEFTKIDSDSISYQICMNEYKVPGSIVPILVMPLVAFKYKDKFELARGRAESTSHHLKIAVGNFEFNFDESKNLITGPPLESIIDPAFSDETMSLSTQQLREFLLRLRSAALIDFVVDYHPRTPQEIYVVNSKMMIETLLNFEYRDSVTNVLHLYNLDIPENTQSTQDFLRRSHCYLFLQFIRTKGFAQAADFSRRFAFYVSRISRQQPNMPFEQALRWGSEFNKELHRLSAQPSTIADIVFSDCKSDFINELKPQRLFDSDVYFIFAPDIVDDDLFMRQIAISSSNSVDTFHPGIILKEHPDIKKIKGKNHNYFVKSINFGKVPSADYELEMADKIRQKGIYVPKPVGILVNGDRLPYVVFEFAENAINLQGIVALNPFEQEEELFRKVKSNPEPVYTALGKYVKTLLDNGIYDTDMATRNFIAQFDEDGDFQRVFMVDFEKTVVKLKLTPYERRKAYNLIRLGMTEEHKKYFNQGIRG